MTCYLKAYIYEKDLKSLNGPNSVELNHSQLKFKRNWVIFVHFKLLDTLRSELLIVCYHATDSIAMPTQAIIREWFQETYETVEYMETISEYL